MKKILFILPLIAIVVFTFSSCKNDDEPNNSLKGTMWTSSYNDDIIVLEFTGSNSVEFYGADQNMNQKGNTYYGTYNLNGNNVTFQLKGAYYTGYDFKTGSITGNSMKVEYDYRLISVGESSNDEYPYSGSKTFRKK